MRQGEDTLSLAAFRADPARVVEERPEASLLDLGEGCLCVAMHTPGNTVGPGLVEALGTAVARAEAEFEALVVAGEGEYFGAGADLAAVLRLAEAGSWREIDGLAGRFQSVLQRLRYSRVPVVAAPFHYALGGAAEITMAADRCQALEETYLGLVEIAVGLVPSGGGCLRMAERWSEGLRGVEGVDPVPFLLPPAVHLAAGKVSSGAAEALELRYLRSCDGVSRRREELLEHARQRALGLARGGYRPPPPPRLRAAGPQAAREIGRRLRELAAAGTLPEHDSRAALQAVAVLCGGHAPAGTALREEDFLDLEREAFVSLCGEERSRERMRRALETGASPGR